MARILVVEDDYEMRSAIGRSLESAGYECVLTSTARSALNVMSTSPADLIILDLYLPVIDGFEFLDESHLPIDGKRPRILAISGGGPTFTANVGLTAARALGVDATLYKPFSRKELITVVRRLLGQGDCAFLN